MFNAKKYLKIKELETILYGGPEVTEFNYEKEASYIGDTPSRSRDTFPEKYEEESDLLVKDSITNEDNIWYEYEYDKENNQVFFNVKPE